jgi:hypothetical protein
MNRHRALRRSLSMIFSENRFALFRIMLWSGSSAMYPLAADGASAGPVRAVRSPPA